MKNAQQSPTVFSLARTQRGDVIRAPSQRAATWENPESVAGRDPARGAGSGMEGTKLGIRAPGDQSLRLPHAPPRFLHGGSGRES